MYEVKTLEGKLVADENMKVAIVASKISQPCGSREHSRSQS